MRIRTITTLIILILAIITAQAAARFDMADFLGFEPSDARQLTKDNPKTLFQTNSSYDQRIAIPVDGVIVHQHGAPADRIAKILQSWSVQNFLPQRMFFADSDAGNHYTQGRFDGQTHFEDIELDQNGKRILCANVRPYMLPTKGWTDYLKTQVKYSIDAGAAAIYPEEPLAHNFTGYEQSFKKAFAEEYNTPWQPPHESPNAFYKTAQLKNKLYINLEQDLQKYTDQYARQNNRPVDFLIPIHSMFSNLSASLIAPLGTSLDLKGHKGYIGQIWTGPVRWTIGQCSNKNITFFDSAYVNYDYFVNLVADSDLKLYLLADPVEDDPSYKWDQYDQWYKECLAAKLIFPLIDTYEIMPWPDRIFLPGHTIGGGTPGPARYRTILMSAITALQDVPLGTRDDLTAGSKGIGMLIGDSAMWQNSNQPVQDPFMGLLIPPLKQGIPISSVPIERSADKNYMKNFRLLMLSYEAWKPHKEKYHNQLLAWVNNGGTLIVFDTKDTFDNIDMFWKQQGFKTPQAHLLSKFKINPESVTSCPYNKKTGKGQIILSNLSPKTFVNNETAQQKYLPLLRSTFQQHLNEKLNEPQYLIAKRGDFLIAHTFDTQNTIKGKFINIFHEDLPVIQNPVMPPNTSQILYDIENQTQSNTPKLLYTTYRLMGKKELPNQTTFLIQGPAGTDGRAKLYTAGNKPDSISAHTNQGQSVKTQIIESEDKTLLIKFPYNAKPTAFKITWK